MKLRQTTLLILSVLLIAPGAVATAWAGDVVLVTNRSVPVTTLSRQDVKNIFLSKKKNVGGVTIKLTALKDDSLTEQFLKAYVGKTPSQFSSYYKKLVFTGKGKPPKSMGSEAEMIAYIARTSGAIGYVSTAAVTTQVKTIEVTN